MWTSSEVSARLTLGSLGPSHRRKSYLDPGNVDFTVLTGAKTAYTGRLRHLLKAADSTPPRPNNAVDNWRARVGPFAMFWLQMLPFSSRNSAYGT